MFYTTKKDLKLAIAEAWPIVDNRNSIPILSHFLLDLGPEPSITANNLDQSITVDFRGTSNRQIKVCLPAKVLKNIIGKLDDGEITLATEGMNGGVLIKSGNLTAQICGLAVDDFPGMPKLERPYKFALDSHVFHKLFSKVNPYISTEETRYYLNGVYMAQDGEKLVTATTDGHQLGKVSIPLPGGAKDMPDIIIPRKAALLAERHSKSKEAAPVGLELTDTNAIFYFEGVKLQTKLIDGTFPDINRVIPERGETYAIMSTVELLDVVKRLFAFKTERTQGLRLGLAPGEAMLSYTSPEIGAVSEGIDVNFVGEPFEIGFNSKYLITLLSSIGSQNVQFHFDGEGHGPALIEDLDDKETTLVLMPMRV